MGVRTAPRITVGDVIATGTASAAFGRGDEWYFEHRILHVYVLFNHPQSTR